MIVDLEPHRQRRASRAFGETMNAWLSGIMWKAMEEAQAERAEPTPPDAADHGPRKPSETAQDSQDARHEGAGNG